MTTNRPESHLLRVGHMTYLNSEVFYRKLPIGSCDLVAMPPRAMAAAVEQGELDAGPLPIAEIFRLGDKIRSLGNLGVASNGPAMSVFLFSHKPVEDLSGSDVAVTTHTATSIQLLRILFAELWNVVDHNFVEMSDGHDVALVIGDPALSMLAAGDYKHQYDLGSAWKTLTGSPFVFAEWVVRADAPADLARQFEKDLIEATERGFDSIDEICRIRANDVMSESDVRTYVRNFSYFLGSSERSGQQEFKSRLAQLPAWRPTSLTNPNSTTTEAIPTS
ncbi:MAG: menaquinone biosynthesis protein [Dehalococcoidia bacterium]|nr:hypothetical protein [Chloroflexota bacterium]MDP6056135.1 menaquinone biosynthesis protein [Dehalococcoidia bacterium]MDP7262555.1 menaquinone biosynthesis protein [Dehalococcoidia bacterium]MDP7485006.1 menaquinone biosynthesis protein [Dehalococcoidia bacterium]